MGHSKHTSIQELAARTCMFRITLALSWGLCLLGVKGARQSVWGGSRSLYGSLPVSCRPRYLRRPGALTGDAEVRKKSRAAAHNKRAARVLLQVAGAAALPHIGAGNLLCCLRC